jgi:hypothetical protein
MFCGAQRSAIVKVDKRPAMAGGEFIIILRGAVAMPAAHLMRLTLLAVKNRKKMWMKLGGKARKKMDLDTLLSPKHSHRPRRR